MYELVDRIQESFVRVFETMISYLPAIIAALIILLIGWLLGRVIGKLVSKLLSKAGVDDIVDKTVIGELLRKSGMTAVGFFNAIAKWFIYLIFITAAIYVLNIAMLADFMRDIALYIPHLAVGIVALVVGLILINMIMKLVGSQLKAQKVPFSDLIALGLKGILFLVVIVFALDQLLLDTRIIYTILSPLAWGLAIGIAIAIGISLGWGSKDTVAKYVSKRLK